MKNGDIKKVVKDRTDRFELSWNGDNVDFMVHTLIPNLKLSNFDKYIMTWAYEEGWEMISDGETIVKDTFLNGVIKCPAGVIHDAINRCDDHTTPGNGVFPEKVWGVMATNAIYYRIHRALGTGWFLRVRRWVVVSVSWFQWWR